MLEVVTKQWVENQFAFERDAVCVRTQVDVVEMWWAMDGVSEVVM
jgi:hypothetical protein